MTSLVRQHRGRGGCTRGGSFLGIRESSRVIKFTCGLIGQRQLIIAWFSATTASHTQWTRFTITRKKTTSTLTIGDTQALRGRLCCQTPVDNILTGFESVNFIQREKLAVIRIP